MARADTEIQGVKPTASGAKANPSAAVVGMLCETVKLVIEDSLTLLFLSKAIRRYRSCAMPVIVWLNLAIALAEYQLMAK